MHLNKKESGQVQRIASDIRFFLAILIAPESNFFLLVYFRFNYLYSSFEHVLAHTKIRREAASPKAGVTGGYEPHNLCAEN